MEQTVNPYEIAYKSIVDFRRLFLPASNELPPAPFHHEWSNSLLNKHGHEAFEGFRESGKTSLILRAFPLYALVFPREEWRYIVVIKNNQREARKALKNIVAEFTTNPMLSANIKKIFQKSSDIFEVGLQNGQIVRIEVYGKGASIRGLNNRDVRPSIIIMDDCQDAADMLSEVVPENDWDWFLSDVLFLGKSTRIFMIGNNLGERCIIEKLRKNPESWGFNFKAIPAANAEMTEVTWPEQTTIEELEAERETFSAEGKLDIWLREKMCMAVDEELQIFKEGMLRYYPPSLKEQIAQSAEIIATLDPASSKARNSCFRAIVVGALMPDGHWYILDVPYGRWDSVELMDKMFEVVRKWGIRDFGVEKGQYQQFLEPVMYREMTIRNCRFNITPMEHGKLGSKLERIKMLQPYFKSGSIWFPSEADWLSEMKSELAGVTRNEIKSEYIDLVDALAMLITQMRVFSAQVEPPKPYLSKEPDYPFNCMTS